MELFIEKNVVFSDKEDLIVKCFGLISAKTTGTTFVQPFPNGFIFHTNKVFNNSHVKSGNWVLNNIKTDKIDINSLSESVIVYGSFKRFKKVLQKDGLEYLIYIPYIENDLNDVIEYYNSKKIPYKLN